MDFKLLFSSVRAKMGHTLSVPSNTSNLLLLSLVDEARVMAVCDLFCLGCANLYTELCLLSILLELLCAADCGRWRRWWDFDLWNAVCGLIFLLFA